ncbi:pentatricopeptide repeat-containing protein At4g30825, chloroplastic [Impatiens glandulifera]|uniref:pentatricopeptide repeat-containing protein At4g30825, chloroplastic n=1 Tax=Impatiens glandulifera TaxID=253017 RepID=UPI001FB17D6C|nr:pentatricopeptide repeat-containing protein At4g30825, chloroplastic [Impatiens glandulifera]
MASFNFSITLDSFEYRKLNLIDTAAFQLSDPCSISVFSKPICKLNRIRVSRLDLEVSSDSPQFSRDGSTICINEDDSIDIDKKRHPRVRRSPKNGITAYKKKNDIASIVENGENLSVERCNTVLKQMERSVEDDDKSLEFINWMRRNGKLRQNTNAYNLAFRILGRKRDWDAAEKLLDEMVNVSGCELNYQVFNTLIYPCFKHSISAVASKWFVMMLDKGIKPNEATFGMLMSIYQKCRNLNEAEFTFVKMRVLGIRCESAYSSMITIYTRLGLYEKTEETIRVLKMDRIALNKENWLVLLNAYCQQGKMEEAEMVLNSMQESGFPPNIIAYNTLITGYGKKSNMIEARRVFNNLRDLGLEPDETTYRSMIEGWGRTDNYKEALFHYQQLKAAGFKPNSSNLYTMIQLQVKYADEDSVASTLNDMVKIGCQYASILGILLQAYEKAERFDRFPLIVRGSFYDHVLTNQTSCSSVVMAYVKHGLVDHALKILHERKWKDKTFQDNLYHLLICSCKDSGFFEEAVQIYNEMPKDDDKPNLHIVGTMIDIYTIVKKFKEGENLYSKLKSSGIALDMIAFSIVVRMYIKAGLLKEACSVLETMEKQKPSIVPDVYLLRDMLRTYQQLGLQTKLENLYYKILKVRTSWDQEMYNCVINCCSRALPVDELSTIFDEMIQNGFIPNSTTFNVILNTYCKAKLFAKARKVFFLAKRRGMVDVISYNTMIAAYGRSKYLKNMSSTVKKMEFDGFSVSLEAYNCMLDAYGKEDQMEDFKSVLEKLRSRGADVYSYNIMMNIYGEKKWIEEVGDVLNELKESGMRMDVCSYNTLIKAYGIAGKVEDAVGIVKEMREQGIEPDRITYVNLITALRNNDEILEAVKWSLWMKQMGF